MTLYKAMFFLLFTFYAAFLIPLFTYFSKSKGAAKEWGYKFPWKWAEIGMSAIMTSPLLLVYDYTHFYYYILSFSISLVFFLTGHGQYMTLNFTEKFLRNETGWRVYSSEKIDFLVRIFFGKDPRIQPPNFNLSYYIQKYGYVKLLFRCLFGLFLDAGLTSLGLSLALLPVIGLYKAAIIFTSIALVGALSYLFSWKLYQMDVNKEIILSNPTSLAETIRGTLTGIIISVLLIDLLTSV